MNNINSTNIQNKKQFGLLSITALGIIYGDIGTSPLYALQVAFNNDNNPITANTDNILGILSLLFWALTIVVTIKYVFIILQADNKGEGGIIALIALIQKYINKKRTKKYLILLGLFGAALFYGDGIITPAISVLSAIEGINILKLNLDAWIIPLTLIILTSLFVIQHSGTTKVGIWFGPIMTIWFTIIGILGFYGIIQSPNVLAALSPIYILNFFKINPSLAFITLGAVVLAVTGVEALYADMGHFGQKPVRFTWLSLVLPALVLNYFGQGAILLIQPEAIENPFYYLAPQWALIPLVILATVATVIASQAVISGAFSLTHQAIQLGYLPRMQVRHTSSQERGQIYVPAINWLLFIAIIGIVISFGKSETLAIAYGIAVTGTMTITTILVLFIAHQKWHWKTIQTNLIIGTFLLIDITFFTANLPKFKDGGWLPIVIATIIFTIISTWIQGRKLFLEHLKQDSFPLKFFIENLKEDEIPIIPGTAIYLSAHLDQVPRALMHSFKHFKSLHQNIIIFHISISNEPFIPINQQLQMIPVNNRFNQAHLNIGFMDQPNILNAINSCQQFPISYDPLNTTFILGRETLLPNPAAPMTLWRQYLFLALLRNAKSRAAYFALPPNRVVELGVQLKL